MPGKRTFTVHKLGRCKAEAGAVVLGILSGEDAHLGWKGPGQGGDRVGKGHRIAQKTLYVGCNDPFALQECNMVRAQGVDADDNHALKPIVAFERLDRAQGHFIIGGDNRVDFRKQLEGEDPFLEVNLFQLMDAFKTMVEQKLPGAPLNLATEQYSLKEKTAYILERLKTHGVMYFQELFAEDRTIPEFIITFLALLELVHSGLLRIFQTDTEKDIQLEALFKDNGDTHHV